MQIDHIIYGQSVVFQAAQTSVQMITLERFLANYYIVNSIELELPEPSFRRVILFLVKNLGNYYSFFGLLGMGIKAITHGRNPFKDGYQTMFCSEYMTAALQQAGLLENLEPEQVGPKEVFEALEAK
jgi:hypothetical protein